MTVRRRGNLRVTYFVLSAMQIMGTAATFPVLVILMADRGLSTSAIGIVLALGAFTIACAEIPLGMGSDRLPRSVSIIAASVLRLCAFAVFATFSEPFWFGIASVIFGLGRAVESGPLQAWFVSANRAHHRVGDAVPGDVDQQLSEGLGSGFAGAAVGGAVGAAVAATVLHFGSGPFLSSAESLQLLTVPVWLGCAVEVVFIMMVIGMRLEKHVPRKDARQHGPVAGKQGGALRAFINLGKNKTIWLFSARWLFMAAGFQAFELLTPLKLADLVASPSSAAAFFAVLFVGTQGCAAVGAACAGAIRRWGHWGRAVVSLTLLSGVLLVAGGLAGHLWILALFFGMAFLVGGPSGALLGPLLHSQVEDDQRATLLSVESTFANVAVGLGSVGLGGVASAYGPSTGLVVGGCFVICAVVPTLFVLRSERRKGLLHG
ncbi:MFS transporter [Serinicoccus chungangensis]|uniref:MFS transporter n=1 Tax=Serinicoccus chungangensis TaxID=767452 RepID=UPI000AFA4312|nr:MFS transporter [Serinicoccus chungangensis]